MNKLKLGYSKNHLTLARIRTPPPPRPPPSPPPPPSVSRFFGHHHRTKGISPVHTEAWLPAPCARTTFLGGDSGRAVGLRSCGPWEPGENTKASWVRARSAHLRWRLAGLTCPEASVGGEGASARPPGAQLCAPLISMQGPRGQARSWTAASPRPLKKPLSQLEGKEPPRHWPAIVSGKEPFFGRKQKLAQLSSIWNVKGRGAREGRRQRPRRRKCKLPRGWGNRGLRSSLWAINKAFRAQDRKKQFRREGSESDQPQPRSCSRAAPVIRRPATGSPSQDAGSRWASPEV